MIQLNIVQKSLNLGARNLPISLKDSGKSRADLWQFAGNIALERAINDTNRNCYLGVNSEVGNPERQLGAIEGRDKCEIKLNKPIPFRSGRKDCIPTPMTMNVKFGKSNEKQHGGVKK